MSIDESPARLAPPAELSELEREVFAEAVLSVKPGHFQTADLPLLAAYARCVVSEREAAAELVRQPVIDDRPSPWLQLHTAALKGMLSGLDAPFPLQAGRGDEAKHGGSGLDLAERRTD
jgi:hypothetical protein